MRGDQRSWKRGVAAAVLREARASRGEGCEARYGLCHLVEILHENYKYKKIPVFQTRPMAWISPRASRN